MKKKPVANADIYTGDLLAGITPPQVGRPAIYTTPTQKKEAARQQAIKANRDYRARRKNQITKINELSNEARTILASIAESNESINACMSLIDEILSISKCRNK
ncbi:hypothetical protein [Iodobacter fluviatilis]|uniref:Uncharacterized protein n=1 Tax=Iodobacter fluviatilis TaxID=537 RepID=A0A7G3GEH4_9NEIS|nr:hypothetical protein [Iodobacter fluviatilis]QBC45857.1 hypothetical protein C1H71_20150 [Iodobacter fluviatilis]